MVGYLTGEKQADIARRLRVDHSTVHYHLDKLSLYTETQIYALLRPQCADGHLSFKCLVCGRPHDNVKSEEFELIAGLRREVAKLQELVASHEKSIRPDLDTGTGALVPVAF